MLALFLYKEREKKKKIKRGSPANVFMEMFSPVEYNNWNYSQLLKHALGILLQPLVSEIVFVGSIHIFWLF